MNNDVSRISTQLKALYSDDPAAKRIFVWFEARQKDSWEMPVRIAADRTGLPEVEVRRVFSVLQDLGCGTLITGRKGYETRMTWTLSIRSIAAAAKGLTDKVEDVSVAPGEALEDEVVISKEPENRHQAVHTFRLRPDFEVKIVLPTDLTEKEAERISGFLRVIPVG